MEYNNLTPELKETAEKAIDIALDILKTKTEKFHSFVIYGEKKNKLERFITDSDDDALEQAIEFIEEIDDNSSAVVYAYQDEIKLKDGKEAAIVMNIYGDEEDNGYSFAQLYRYADNKIQLSDEKLFLGNIRNVLIF
ncbi:hypothetical protein [Pedobacter cryoconitis]|uniref:Uncharacterized protein n=1 Tax=Pedobacter cryoconitis TaxID=188932 RepID=A0A7X0J3B4_9SPHI|nr:hypothetical protein [Pedobacter cryoconitis]MBB6499899.1 hypothetical protein [Pedobacter cryoconitis]